jgi:putative ABC transport system permease protein
VHVDPGFDPRGAVTVSFDLDLQGYTSVQRDAFVGRLVDRASAGPDVTSAAVTSSLPLSGRAAGAEVSADTAPPVAAALVSVSPRYFGTVRVPLVRGREFSEADTADAPAVVILNETLARRLWPEADPIGRRLRITGGKEPSAEIVGVVRDVKYASLTEPSRPGCYVPLKQRRHAPLSLVVRTAGDSTATLASLSEIARGLDRDLPLFDSQTLESIVHQAVNVQRASASLFAVFGGLALMLAAIGVYGVVAHSVSVRTREVGIRMSLGARTADVVGLFVSEGVTLSLIGVGAGLALSTAASRLLNRFLFGLAPTDLATFAGGAAILSVVVLSASYIPARRAARVEPLAALRQE